MSKISECYESLEKEAAKKGYLTPDEIEDAAFNSELSSVEYTKLTEQLLLNGIIISDEPPPEDVEQNYDYSRLDYDLIYNEVVSIDPELGCFVDQIRVMPTPQKGEIEELYAKMKHFNFEGIQAKEARERMIIIHMRVVLKIALSLVKQFDYDLSDAISVGMIALISAVDKYDPEQNGYFGTYAAQSIWGDILRECQPKWIHTFPTHIMDKLYAVIRAYNDYYGTSTELEMPDEDFLTAYSEQTGEPIDKIKSYFILILNESNWLSLEEAADNEDECYDERFFVLDHIPEWDDNIYRMQISEKVHKSLSALTERQLQVIRLRYGFENGIPVTLDEIGRKLNLTRERIRQIEEKALMHLRKNADIRALKDEVFVSKKSSITDTKNVVRKTSYNFGRMRSEIIAYINSLVLLFPDSEAEIEDVKTTSNEKLLRIAPRYGINPENYVVYITQ